MGCTMQTKPTKKRNEKGHLPPKKNIFFSMNIYDELNVLCKNYDARVLFLGDTVESVCVCICPILYFSLLRDICS